MSVRGDKKLSPLLFYGKYLETDLTINKIFMAEINTPAKNKSSKYQHKNIRVDLTPMVDLGFLLITFFILTTTMQQPAEIKLILPKDSPVTTDVPASRTLTFILNKNDSISYYDGFASEIKHARFGDMRNIILQKQRSIRQKHSGTEGIIIIIKPATESTYKNFIDALDEVYISYCKNYFVAEPTKNELL